MRISDWSSDVCSSDLERLVGDLALAVAGFVEVDGVDDAGQVRVGLDDAAHGGGELLAEGLGGFLLRPLERLAAAGPGPAGFGWQAEADQRRRCVADGPPGVAVPVGLGRALDLVADPIRAIEPRVGNGSDSSGQARCEAEQSKQI